MKYFTLVVVALATLFIGCSEFTEPITDFEVVERSSPTPITITPVCDIGTRKGVRFDFVAKEDGTLFVFGYLPKGSDVYEYRCIKNGYPIEVTHPTVPEQCDVYLDLYKGDTLMLFIVLTQTPLLGEEYWFGDWQCHFNQLEFPTLFRVYDKCADKQITRASYN